MIKNILNSQRGNLMIKRFIPPAVIIALILTLAIPAIPVSKPKAAASSLPQLIKAYNDSGFRMFSKLTHQSPKSNIFISPASLDIALSMAYEGSKGTTRSAMAKGLGLQGMSFDQLGSANSALLSGLKSTSGTTLDVANSLWMRRGAEVLPTYKNRIHNVYKAQLSTLDFNSPEAPNTINAWVKKKTRGRIDSIIQSLDPADIMVLVNAVYFKGKWNTPFPKSDTNTDTFTDANHKKLKTKFMRRSDLFSYLENKEFQAVELPYKNCKMSMFVFLPKPSVGLARLRGALTSANWNRWMTSFQDREGKVVLPRFKMEYETRNGIMSALSDMGMGIMFAPGKADFSRMCRIPPTPPVYIGNVVHKANIEVNEEGTIAVAVTSMEPGCVGIQEEPIITPFVMKVNRPFFFAIRDNSSQLILFMGAVTNPAKG